MHRDTIGYFAQVELGMIDDRRALELDQADTVGIVLPTALGDALASVPSIWMLATRFSRNRKCIVSAQHATSLFAGLDLRGADCLSDRHPEALHAFGPASIVFDFRSTDDSPSILASLRAQSVVSHAFIGASSDHHYCIQGDLVPPLTFAPGWSESEEASVDSAWGMDAGLVCAALGLARPSTDSLRDALADFRSRQSWPEIPTSKLVFLAPCGSSALKKWPDEHWNALALLLHAAGFDVAVAIGPEDADPVSYATPHQTLNCVSLSELASHFQQGHCVVANDCGPMHLAAVFGCPTLAIFGPTNEDIWFPYGARIGKALRSGPRNRDRNGGLLGAAPWSHWPHPSLVYSEILSLRDSPTNSSA